MNTENNGRQPNNDPTSHGETSRDVELTALALGQLDQKSSRDVQSRISHDPRAKRTFDETQRIAAAIEQSAAEGLPAGIEGLEAQLEQAFDEQAELSGDDKVLVKSKNHQPERERQRWLWLAICATLAMVLGSVAYLMLPAFQQNRVGLLSRNSGETWADKVAVAGGAQLEEVQLGAEPTVKFSKEQINGSYKLIDNLGATFGEESFSSSSPQVAGDPNMPAHQPDPAANGQQKAQIFSITPTKTAEARTPPTFSNSDSVANASPYQVVPVPDGGKVMLGGITRNTRGDETGIPTTSSPLPEGLRRGGGGGMTAEESEWGLGYRFYHYDHGERDKHALDYGRYRRGNEQYELPPENAFVPVAGQHALSTFAIDVDTASYANMRRFITNRQLPPPQAVRIEELINYFQYDYPQPQGNAPFSVNMEVATCPWNPRHKLLRVGIKGKEIHRNERPASNLVFLLDVSGSMADADKLPLLKRAMSMLVDHLNENDRVSIVTYAGNAGTRLQPTSGDQKQAIRGVIDSLGAGGSTHGSAGIQMAYDLASANFIEDGVNRVILATDGDLNVGITRDDALVRLIQDRAQTGVFLSVLGFGTGNLKDAKLEKLADNGNGNYSYIDSIREARKVLIEEMSGSLVTIAKDVKIQIEFNPAEIRAYRQIGYENRALANQDFANDRVDAGDIGAGHTVTALYELVTTETPAGHEGVQVGSGLRYQRAAKHIKDEAAMELTEAASSGELMTLFLRFKDPDASESELMEFPIKDSDSTFEEASRDFRFAASVASFGMIVRRSQHAGNSSLAMVEQTAADAIGDDPQGHRSEFVDLVRQVASMWPAR